MAKMSMDKRHAIEAFAGVFDNTSRKPIEHNTVDMGIFDIAVDCW